MIYFDNASTSFPKPYEVRRAVEEALAAVTSHARGVGAGTAAAGNLLYDLREAAARFFGADGPEGAVLTLNATHALNIVIRGVLGRGGTALVSGYEHNAVMRPLFALNRTAGVRILPARSRLFDDEAFLAAWKRGLGESPDLAILSAVSNVYGWILPWREAARLAEKAGVPFLLDASQAAGHLPAGLSPGVSFLAAPGHKGLLGPAGTGLLILGPGIRLPPLLFGGTGHDSASRDMPPFPPERFEAGTQNLPGAAGLLAGIRKVESLGLSSIARYEASLLALAREELAGEKGIRTFFAGDAVRQSGLFSFVLPGEAPEETAAALAEAGFAVRAGLHCAPDAHRSAGNPEGSVRISFSCANTPGEVESLVSFLRERIRKKTATEDAPPSKRDLQ